MSWLAANATEVVGNLLALWCIYLIARNSVWNWPVGIANCVFYIALFYPAKLYGDSFLQCVYIVLSLYGIYQWLFGLGGVRKHQQGQDTERPITQATAAETAMYAAGLAAGAAVLWWFERRFTNTDVPFWDGATAAACLAATWMLAHRKIESWWVWIGTNVSYFFLYHHKGLILTQWCQIVFLAVSVAGYVRWLRELKAGRVPVTA